MTGYKIKLHTKNVKTTIGGRKVNFKTFFTQMKIVVVGEEDKDKQLKWVTVKFRKEVDTSKLGYGILCVENEDIWIPYKYEVKEEIDENGIVKKKYPTIWIRAYTSFEPMERPKREVEKDAFVQDEQDTEQFETAGQIDEDLKDDNGERKLPF